MRVTTRSGFVAACMAAALLLVVGATAARPSVAAAQASADEQSIMDVVEAFNNGMIDATAKRDPTIVQDYLTDEFYRQMDVQMRSDWAEGVAGVNLVDLEWGTISVNGDSATAYTVETWSVKLADGSGGEMPPEINLYRLVRENGAWKVDANDHPGSQM